ncbi:MAG: TetR/AcrR family transcriptional regulator C-terminal domain-containing protein [Acidaminococcaceae bacterium]|nr:TetR/AcrR family transcriptional regulator C-terminal domain-containing protein [Acidaminococcaceae bacterium]
MIIRQTTKEVLAASIMELAKTKSVDKISVKEIVKNCGLTATTFYNHFQDKYQLLAWIYNRNIEELLADTKSPINWQAALIAFCTPLQENRAFYKNVLKNTAGQTSFRYQTNDYAIALWMEYIRKREGWQEVPDEISFYFRFYMRALSEAINDWFLDGEKMPVEELAARIDVAMPEPLKPYLRNR